MPEKVKLMLRINHNRLDETILDTIEEARAELLRSGVSIIALESENPLIASAIKTYCGAKLASDPGERERYERSFVYQQDCIRKSDLQG